MGQQTAASAPARGGVARDRAHPRERPVPEAPRRTQVGAPAGEVHHDLHGPAPLLPLPPIRVLWVGEWEEGAEGPAGGKLAKARRCGDGGYPSRVARDLREGGARHPTPAGRAPCQEVLLHPGTLPRVETRVIGFRAEPQAREVVAHGLYGATRPGVDQSGTRPGRVVSRYLCKRG